MKKILFRADGNADIGAGHIMRCLSLGIAARRLGIQCKYVVADDSFSTIIEEYGFEYEILNTDYSKMDAEWDKTITVIREFMPDVILVDSYYVTYNYLDRLKRVAKLAYIDDIKSFAYPVDILINYNPGAVELDYWGLYKENRVKLPQMLLGESFVPLREEFQQLQQVPAKKNAADIFFSAGGADPERIALRFLQEVLCTKKLENYRFHLVLGAFEPDIEEIKALAEKNLQINIYQNVREISKLMNQCDIAVSAAGSTLYELCACGIPTITYILADNQILGEKSLCGKGIMKSAGDVRTKKDFWSELMEMIYTLCDNYEERVRMQERAAKTVDGMGAERTIQTIFVL